MLASLCFRRSKISLAKMSTAAGHRHPKCHVLNFWSDKKDSCTLTVLVNSIRFHIIANGNRFNKFKDASGPEGKLAREYKQLFAKVIEADDDFTRPSSIENLRTRAKKSESSDSQDSGHGTSDGREDASEDNDSAIDVQEQQQKTSQLIQDALKDPGKALNNFLLTPFGPIFDENAPPHDKQETHSVQEWYSDRVTFFFSLWIKDGQLRAEEEEATEDLERKMIEVMPKLYLPKYLRQMDIPWFAAKDLTVLEASEEIGPYHPSRVTQGDETYFLKTIDPTQSSPTKREVPLMKKIEQLGLHEKIRVPLVKGWVGVDDSKTEAMGFLMTEIEEPRPLTHMLDDEVPQSKRDKWAAESARIKEVLHEHKIVWGDAKADNFMVDKHDDLWIIDFGGSFTTGWIDPELMESMEGDDMGVERIVNALRDPNANTWDPNEDKTVPGNKRKVGRLSNEIESNESAETEEGQSPPRKRARPDHVADDKDGQGDDNKSENQKDEKEEPVSYEDEEAANDEVESATDEVGQEQYCICDKPSSGGMVACDNDDCHRQWFHFECVGLKGAPKSKHWYCDDCKDA